MIETVMLQPNTEGIEQAARLLRNGQLVAIPTETVYGLAVNALDGKAVSSVFTAKGRPMDNPLIVHIGDMADWAPLVTHIPENAQKLADAFWPGPLTIILPAAPHIPKEVTGGLTTVAVRFPSHPIAQAVILHSGCPLAAPSANRSGSPSPTNAARVAEDMNGRIAAILDGGDCAVGVESTVIDLCHTPPRLLRPGGITPKMLEQVVGTIEIDPAVTHALENGAVAASPGMKYKHYAPQAEVSIVAGTPTAYIDYVNAHADDGDFALCFEEDAPHLRIPAVTYGQRSDPLSQAQQLFDALRQLDEQNAHTVYAACPPVDGIGLAVYNRLLRAAAFRVIPAICIIGLTGPTGAGKSSAAAVWQEMGAYIVDTDRLARQVVLPGSPCLQKLVDAFGNTILFADGTLNRSALAKIAFSDAKATAKLNAITHPAILALTKAEIETAAQKGYTTAVVDAPLLFEAGFDAICHHIVAVIAPYEQRKARIMSRDKLTADAAELRISAQKQDEFYCRDDVTVIQNNDDEETLHQIAKAILTDLEARCISP